jgi:HSP20 family protein
MSMLATFDPVLRDFDRIAGSILGSSPFGGYSLRTGWAPRWMPADVYRHGDEYVAKFDLPGVDPASIEVTVEKNVLTVSAERNWAPDQDSQVVLLAERPQGRFSRQLFLGEDLETDKVGAHYDQGVLTVTIPISEYAKPKKVQITSGTAQQAIETGVRQN